MCYAPLPNFCGLLPLYRQGNEQVAEKETDHPCQDDRANPEMNDPDNPVQHPYGEKVDHLGHQRYQEGEEAQCCFPFD